MGSAVADRHFRLSDECLLRLVKSIVSHAARQHSAELQEPFHLRQPPVVDRLVEAKRFTEVVGVRMWSVIVDSRIVRTDALMTPRSAVAT